MDVRAEMLGLLEGRRQGFTLPRPFYIDPDFFRTDLETIWYKDWLFVGHDCELDKPGAFFTVQVGEYAVVLVRDLKGTIRAFHNTCRHRGSRVCTTERGSAVRLVCPYHQWSYDLDGRLLFARQVAEGFDKSAYGLKPVACESVAGYLFICLADSAPDFAPFRRMMEPYFAPHKLTEAKLAYQSTIIEQGNWKLVWENNRECYHCSANHPELCKTFPEAPTATGIQSADTDPDMLELWTRCEGAGLPARFRIDPSGQFRTTRTPLLRDAVSYTLSGMPAVGRNLSDAVSTERIGSLMLYHYPTTWNHVLIDHATTFRVLPISANETAVTTKWLVHKDAVEGVDYDLKELIHVWTETNTQDRRIIEENARGIHSPAYEPGPYSTVHEGGVIQFVDWYARTIEPRLAGETLRPQEPRRYAVVGGS
jgi:Rieske 2Fe-2S family protein